MAETEALRKACERIAEVRQTEATITVVDAAGKPIPDLRVHIEQRTHRFPFGTMPLEVVQGVLRPNEVAVYDERLFSVFNDVTWSFSWRYYEGVRGRPRHDLAERTLQWAGQHDATVTGHQLIYTSLLPEWFDQTGDPAQQAALADARVRETVDRFRGRIPVWIVANETKNTASLTSMLRGRALFGPLPDSGVQAIADYVDPAFRRARESDPSAVLLINDESLAGGREIPRVEAILKELKRRGTPFDAIGLQSHLKGEGRIPLDRVEANLTHLASYGRLYLTEVSVPSEPQRPTENVFAAVPWAGWSEQTQAGYAVALYTIAFAHPSVDGITYWSFSDRPERDALTARTGLLREDLSPRPAYDALRTLIREVWWTRWDGQTARDGRIHFRAFYGDHVLTATLSDGREVRVPVRLTKRDESITVTLP